MALVKVADDLYVRSEDVIAITDSSGENRAGIMLKIGPEKTEHVYTVVTPEKVFEALKSAR